MRVGDALVLSRRQELEHTTIVGIVCSALIRGLSHHASVRVFGAVDNFVTVSGRRGAVSLCVSHLAIINFALSNLM